MFKKKIRMFLFLGITLFGTLLGINNVHAQTDSIGMGRYLSTPYYYNHTRGSSTFWEQARFIIRYSDNEWVYCVQPFFKIAENNRMEVTTEDLAAVANISYDNWKRIEKIAYYGYGYVENGYDHSDERWYAASQMLIWKLADPNVDSYFTSTLHGARDDSILAAEMNEINYLVDTHTTTPKLNNMPNEMVIGNTITVNDDAGVLSRYDISDVVGGTVTKEGNSLKITATRVGTLSFSLNRLGNRYGEPVRLYYAVDSQNAVRRGNIDPIKIPKNITVYGGKVTPVKTDEDTNTQTPQGEATLEGAVYGIYKEDGTKVGTVSTGKNGRGTSDYLPSLGRFYLLEEKPSTGYQLDKNKYYFDVTLDNLNPEVQVFEKVINLDFDFTKVYANEQTGEMEPEKGIYFGIYNNKGQEVKNLKTDNQGNIKFNLPYGTYTVKQLTSTKNYEKVDDFTIEVKQVGEVVRKVLANAEIKAKLRVVKIDSETKEVIKRTGIKFKIFNVDTNEYVCQTTSYPKMTICVFETDKNGEFITPYVLNSGKYRLEEVDQVIDGYLWNKESHEFEIGENSELRMDSEYGIIFDTYFENQRVKGKIEINKEGEVINLTDDGYEFTTEPLEGVTFGLFKKDGTKIKEGKTSSDGKLIFEDIELGDYYIQELSTLDGYVLDKTKHVVTLKYKDQYTPIIKYKTLITNKVPTGKLIFTKTDFSESKTLPNTLIEIYNEEGEKVFSGRTSESGQIIIERLPVGKYKLYEKEAPENYKLNPDAMEFEIKEDGEIIKCNMKDELIVEVPNTDKTDYKEAIIGGIILIITGAGIVVYANKKRKK